MPSIKKWGNSFAIRIPTPLAQQLRLTENMPVDCAVVDGSLVVRPVAVRPPYSLDQLLDRITGENIHGETDIGRPAGKEIW